MSCLGRTAVFAVAPALLGCRDEVSRAPASVASRPEGSQAAAPSPTPPTATRARGPADEAAGAEPHDAEAAALATARIVTLAVQPGAPPLAGVFSATLEAQGRTSEASLALALGTTPRSVARRLAYYALARALGARVVPPTALRRLGAGELAKLLAADPAAMSLLSTRASIMNDGTVDAVLWSAPRGRPVSLPGSAEASRLASRAQAPVADATEDAGLVRDYVEAEVLDFLAGNVLRREASLDEAAGRLVLADNATAFPLQVDPRALDRPLARLRPIARFPRGLRRALEQLDRGRARSIFQAGRFEQWLLSPRALLDLDERRAALLTLIDARVAERGEEAVLCL